MTPHPRPEDVDLVIFHKSCTDGFTAAWAAWKLVGERAEYVACQYAEDPPDVQGKNVAIVDLSFPRKTLERMAKEAKSLIVLDHHKSAKKDLDASDRPFFVIGEMEFDLTIGKDRKALVKALQEMNGTEETKAEVRHLEPFPNAIFDMEKSGALITWEWFNPGKPVPLLVQHVSDRDLWTFNMADTRAVHAGLGLTKFTFDHWDLASNNLEDPEDRIEFLRQGKIVLKHIDVECKSIAKHAVLIEFEGVRMWTTNYSGRYNSDVAQILRERETEEGNGDIPGVSMTWFYDDEANIFRCSLRSIEERADVSEIAFKYGGGGHRHAAGFEWTSDIRDLVRRRA